MADSDEDKEEEDEVDKAAAEATAEGGGGMNEITRARFEQAGMTSSGGYTRNGKAREAGCASGQRYGVHTLNK